MCENCYNGKISPIFERVMKNKKEITFTAPTGDKLSYCTDCYNTEFDNMKNFYCEECEKFHDITEKNYEEYDSKYLCNSCYWEALSEIEKQEQIEEEYYRLSK